MPANPRIPNSRTHPRAQLPLPPNRGESCEGDRGLPKSGGRKKGHKTLPIRLATAFQEIILTVSAFTALTACHASTDAPITDSGISEDTSACDPIPIDGSSIEPDAEAGCASFKQLPCGLPPSDAGLRGCYVVDLAICHSQCDLEGLFYCQLAPTICSDGSIESDRPVVLECNRCAIAGRRPIGLVESSRSSSVGDGASKGAPLGEYFASMAYLEAASVRAFVDLARWLEELGAPAHLTREALRAAQDERRHARVASRWARKFGAKRGRVRARSVARPSLLALLEDNVVEGCVGETFGALVVSWQARHSEDARIRRAMERIAADETRHAALAWETLAWGIRRISKADRHHAVTRLRAKIDASLAALERHSRISVTRDMQSIAGHPAPRTALRLAQAVARVVRAESKTSL